MCYSAIFIGLTEYMNGIVFITMPDGMYSDGGFAMPGDEMEAVGEQEGGGWDVDEELELPPDLVSRSSLLVFYSNAVMHVVTTLPFVVIFCCAVLL